MEIPLQNISPFFAATVRVECDQLVLRTDPRLWAWSAEARFDVPEMARRAHEVTIDLAVESGKIGVGWLRADEQAWITQASADPDVAATSLRLVIPAGTQGGRLIFVNWTTEDRPAVARVKRIAMLPIPDAMEIPLQNIAPFFAATVRMECDQLVLRTDPRLWAWSAEARFDPPEMARRAYEVTIDLAVESGKIGVGWLRADEQAWITQASADPDVAATSLRLVIPAGTQGGRLIFVNWTTEDRPAVARVKRIAMLPIPDANAEFCEGKAAEEDGRIEAAIERYKSTLRIDPSHLEAIIALGRLRFVAPKQPILDEMERRAPADDHCQVVIAIRNPCNYRCHYCVAAGANNVPVKPIDLDKLQEHYASIGCARIDTTFECGGGEPTIHPQFRDLLRVCARYGPVDFPTNNSQDPRRWLPTEVADRVSIRGALHPEGELQLERYLRYAKSLLNAGCRFRCDYIAHPTRLDRVRDYADLFQRNDIPFIAIPYIGTYGGKSYPYAYSEDDKRMIEPYSPLDSAMSNPEWRVYVRISSSINRIRNFRGLSCLSGFNSVHIDEDGQMRRCLYDHRPIAERLRCATPCDVKHCGCGVPLEKLSFSSTGYWPKLAELDPMAQTLGYPSAEAGIAAEYIEMYDALMSAYGKNEFPE